MSSRHMSFVKLILVASVGLVAICGSSLGQAPARVTYKEYPPDPALLANKKSGQQQAGRILRGTQPFDEAGKNILDKYYKEVVFRELTTHENWGSLPELRNEILKDLRSARNPQAFQHVMTLTFQQMRSFTQSRFNLHPAVRYNAMLLLGELNAVERGTRGADGQAAAYPDPLPAVFDVLVAEYQSPDQIDAVRVAALVGIDRHLKLDLVRPADRRIPPAKKQVVFDEMIALLNASPPAGRSVEGHTWMQRRAIEISAVLGTIGTKPEANAALEKIVADTAAPISLRCTASEALAHWAPTSNKIDAGTVSKNLGLLAVKACKDELDRIAALEREEKDMKTLRELIKKPNPVASGQFGSPTGAGAGGSMSMEMYSGSESESAPGDMYGGGDDMMAMYGGADGGMYGSMLSGKTETPTDPRIDWSRRRLKYQLTCVKHGLEGMTIAGKSSQHEKAVERISKAVEAALVFTDPEKPTLEGLSESIRKGVMELAFLSPEVAAIAAEPVSDLPVADLPTGIAPTVPGAPAAATPAAVSAPAGDPLAPPLGGIDPLDLQANPE